MKRRCFAMVIPAISAALIIFGSLGTFQPSAAGSELETTSGPLHNDTAQVEEDCPDDDFDYFHFVLAPNNNQSAFVSITLNLGGDLVTFTGDDIIAGGNGQLDNVFIQVPAGYELGDLDKEGSEATWTGPATKWVLSHVCEGSGYGTTTTTTAPTTTTSTTAPTTTSTTSTTVPSTTTSTTSTTVPTTTTSTTAPTTTTSTTTTVPSTTSTTQPGGTTSTTLGGPTTTVPASTPTTTPGTQPQLPRTGENINVLLMIAGVLLLTGFVLVAPSRIRRR